MSTDFTNRRDFFARTSDGVFGAALAHLLCSDFFGGTSALANEASERTQHDLRPRAPHHPAKATSVIHLFMNGGPSQMDLFDPKPIAEPGMDGQPYPGNVEEIGNSKHESDVGVMMGGQYGKFQRHGDIGDVDGGCVAAHVPDFADDICLINSMWTDHPNHDNALYKIHSGRLVHGVSDPRSLDGLRVGIRKPKLAGLRRALNDPLGAAEERDDGIGRPAFLPPIYQGTPFSPDRFSDSESETAVRTAVGRSPSRRAQLLNTSGRDSPESSDRTMP